MFAPFPCTGTVLTPLLQSGLIRPGQPEHKFRQGQHASKIALPTCYIAAINIESVCEARSRRYAPFNGILLADTLAVSKGKDELALVMPDTSGRRRRQDPDIHVIMGNPRYAGLQPVTCPHLDDGIGETFADRATATNKNALYGSYVRAIAAGFPPPQAGTAAERQDRSRDQPACG
ncbi:hypothetical protein [Pseudogemmobacter bohemicus]|uniref:hypothetical protein n=1 Tax=Pseudogemmobacter bohemicus TaxID=2250708 RepID=UPI000DD36496|nr:hypothetical protein [Pseudogemmobacter bohemicus]